MTKSRRKIELNGEVIFYTLREDWRIKNLKITIKTGGEVFVNKPKFLTIKKMEKFLQQKADWILEKIELAKRKQQKNPLFSNYNRENYLKYKNEALQFATKKVEEFNKFYNFKFSKISVRNQKTIWGSCSARGNLNYNYKILFLPEKLADYIIVHELCHLKELNHSRKFWQEVEKVIPDFKERVKELRDF